VALPPQKPGAPAAPRPGSPARSSAIDPQQPESSSLGDALRYNEELTREVAAVEEAVELLKVRYEQWFIGIERREPQRERDELKRQVARLKTAFTRNTGLRFRIQSLYARFVSYERMWQRSARQKEEGTYRRDVLRARRLAEKAAAEKAAARADAPAAPAPTLARETARAVTAPPPPAAAPRPTPLPTVPGLSEAQLRALHSEYVEAKRRCAEDTSRFTVDTLARSLARQVPELLSRYGARTVEFRVAVKDGKTILRAVPRS
jgi:hypothetical protein